VGNFPQRDRKGLPVVENFSIAVFVVPYRYADCFQLFFSKVATARKFDAEKFVNEYLEDYHTPLTPGTYQGKRLPQWLIKVIPFPTVKVPSPKVALNGA
jgi:hypothetical protein